MDDSDESYGDNEKEKLRSSERHSGRDLLYGLEDEPAWYICIWLGLQHCFLSATSIALVPILLGPSMCMFDDDVGFIAKTKFTSSLYFVTGLATILQCTLGTRLPIFQGTTFTLLAPVLAVLSLPYNKCPQALVNEMENGTVMYNDTDGTIVDGTELWQRRMREIQGSLAVASLFEVFIGITGATSILVKLITPLTVAPAIALIGLDLFAEAARYSSTHWGVSFFCVVLLTILSQYLYDVSVPVPTYNRKTGWNTERIKPFGMFAVLITIAAAWLLCHILTISGVLPSDPSDAGYEARTDTKVDSFRVSPWLYVPYPGHMGLPVVSAAGILATIIAVFAGAVESVGDYHACAKILNAPPPPPHAIARGITVEGIGCILAGLLSGSGSTSFSNNIAAISITRVGSRRVMIFAGIIMMIMGACSKFGAIFLLLPTPVIGGMFIVTFGMLAAVGLSMLQHIDLNVSRNQYILGVSLFMGLLIPEWMKLNPGVIQTGVMLLDQTFTVLLKTAIFVGGFIACLLDNTIPGSLRERGILSWNGSETKNQLTVDEFCYDLTFSTDYKFSKYIPIFPEHGKHRRKRKKIPDGDEVRICETDC